MKDVSSIPGEFNPNYEERRKEFAPVSTRTPKAAASTKNAGGGRQADRKQSAEPAAPPVSEGEDTTAPTAP